MKKVLINGIEVKTFGDWYQCPFCDTEGCILDIFRYCPICGEEINIIEKKQK